MSLIKCPECDKEISDKVKSCPHCGYPLQEEVDKAQKSWDFIGKYYDEKRK